MNLHDAIQHLGEVDDQLASIDGARRTLAPAGGRATALATLGERLLPGVDRAVAETFVRGVCEIAAAQAEHFPETIFWDFDFLAASVVALADADVIAETCAEIATLQSQYGRHSVIRFRYVHDFTYGFDWAKWVSREPQERAGIGPFDPKFVRYLRRRGDELAALIAADDEKYPKLADGTPRNPFGFSREPDAERALGLELARRGLVPAATWRTDACPVWDRPFAALREEVALQMHLDVPASASSS